MALENIGIPSIAIVVPTVSGSGEITGYAPIAYIDNGNGTVSPSLLVSISATANNFNLDTIGGTDQTGADWTPLLQHLNIDLSTRSSEATLSSVKTDLDTLLSQLSGMVSSTNSTSTPLVANDTFTGTYQDSLTTAISSILVRVDQTGTLYVDNSEDGITADRTFTFPITNTSIGTYFALSPRARYWRIRYTNGATAQALCRIQTISFPFARSFSFLPVNITLTDDSTAQTTRTILAGKKDDGTYTNIRATDDNRLRVSSILESSAVADTGKLFVIATSLNTFAQSGTEYPFLLIRNPANSGKTVKIRNVIEGIVSTNKPTTFRIYFQPTITSNGTIVTPANKKSGDSTASIVNAYKIPTISNFGSPVDTSVVVAGVFIVPEDFSLQLPEGRDLLITVLPTVNNTDASLTVDWSEI